MALVNNRSTLLVWRDVIFAIFLREIRSKFNDKLGISWSVVSPLIFILILTLMRSSVDGGTTHTMPTFFFMVYGIMLVQFFITTVSSVAGAINSNKSLFAFRQVQPISSIIAIAGLELLSRVFVALVIITIAYFMKVELAVNNPIGIISTFFLIWILGTSVGMLFALTRCYIPEVDKLRTLILRPLLFISAVFFSLRDVPQEMWKFMTWNPILHAVEYTRYYAYPTYGNVGVDIYYLGFSTLIIFFFSLCCYHALWKSAISRL
ncbi:ABC transporter permease [Enterovibrio norvegicus]|uniref:Transport permease protein n=1 Tax=Enterovibrio norvegicus DSM 15893 TaxID=1121869 RepID=A0A1I5S7W9_9GAMM|nr:ABC transporter permease [Enterovibrio norvegicus]SFP66779.1 capsular polysaccharide transport system permease protein [Enterovibrio norvegicus DSM 15893]